MNARNRRAGGCVDIHAAVYAGITAGILATLVQIALWSIFTDALPAIVFRDARFAAAIVLGRGVLPPPSTFDAPIVLVATSVHFALAITYGLMLSRIIAAQGMASSHHTGGLRSTRGELPVAMASE